MEAPVAAAVAAVDVDEQLDPSAGWARSDGARREAKRMPRSERREPSRQCAALSEATCGVEIVVKGGNVEVDPLGRGLVDVEALARFENEPEFARQGG